jgi:hypothetical protein
MKKGLFTMNYFFSSAGVLDAPMAVSVFSMRGKISVQSIAATHKAQRLAQAGLLLLCLFSMTILLGACGGPSEDPQTVVDHYYSALSKHDYDTAIHYLQVTGAPNPAMNVTTAGELKTMDTSYGSIQSYKINSQSINDQYASVNVTVSRGYPYTMDVQLNQINNAWIITGGGAPMYLY